MLSATRRACQLLLLHSLFPVPRMGNSASNIVSPQEALPGRKEQTPVAEKTGHAEVVRVVYQPEHISFEELLKVFWENHDPTQGMRQGNDHGTQYRSAIYPTSAKQMEAALSSKENYQKVLSEHGFGPITTDIREGQTFFYAEDYHQQYLSKNPNGYCGLGGTGVSCPVGIKK
uniref:peptide-methionine (S)-S-oxide reductase n=1 Tax=Gorilla gorilla gorilla TaxID=9595 RepID=A0A2I2ZNG4_GORGO